MKYQIYQLHNPIEHEYAFSFYDEKLFNMKDYGKPVYKGYLNADLFEDDEEALEVLFCRFNINLPSDYYGRSLCASDVIQLDDKFYYCQPRGWKDVTEKASQYFQKHPQIG